MPLMQITIETIIIITIKVVIIVNNLKSKVIINNTTFNKTSLKSKIYSKAFFQKVVAIISNMLGKWIGQMSSIKAL
jgi:hypothetical protein